MLHVKRSYCCVASCLFVCVVLFAKTTFNVFDFVLTIITLAFINFVAFTATIMMTASASVRATIASPHLHSFVLSFHFVLMMMMMTMSTIHFLCLLLVVVVAIVVISFAVYVACFVFVFYDLTLFE